MNEVTRILERIESGDPSASDELLPLVYNELRNLARQKLAREKPGQTLGATALVHEAYLRLIGDGMHAVSWDSRGHFFAAAAEAMRRIFVEKARRKARIRHGGELKRIAIPEASPDNQASAAPDDVLSIHEALDTLQRVDPMAAHVVKLHYFLGLSFAEAAELLHISERTAYRNWSFARAWLYQRLRQDR